MTDWLWDITPEITPQAGTVAAIVLLAGVGWTISVYVLLSDRWKR